MGIDGNSGFVDSMDVGRLPNDSGEKKTALGMDRLHIKSLGLLVLRQSV